MGKDVSLAVSLSDKVSPVLKAMTGYTKAFDKSMEELDRQVHTLEKSQKELAAESANLQVRLKQVNKVVSQARKEADKYGDALHMTALQDAIEEQNQLKLALENSRVAMKSNQQSYKDMINTFRSDAVSLRTGDQPVQATSGTSLAALGKAGIGNLIGQSVSQALGTGLESQLGQPLATAFGSTISGIVSGASMGMIAGTQGAIIGGLVGLGSGLLSAATTVFNAKDDTFKSYVQETVKDQIQSMDNTLTSGSTIAGSREQTRLAFAQRFGDEAVANAYLDQVKTMARNTNYSFDEITGYSKALLNTYAPDEVFGVLQSLSDATAGLGLNESDVNVMIQGLSRMRTTGKATMEYLNFFGERGVDVYSALSNATGADRADIAEMVSRGEISGDTAAQAILDYINATFGGLSEKLSGTYDAMVDNLADAQAEIDTAMGEGYNEARKEGIQAQSDWLGGSGGEAVAEAYRSIGAWKASLENEKEQLMRQYIDEAMASDEYQTADAANDAATMGRLIMEAKVKAQNEYNASEGAQLMLESELSLIDSVRNNTALNEDYYDAGYRLGTAFSHGRLAALAGNSTFLAIPDISGNVTTVDLSAATGLNGYATGLSRVPYDNFPALLHEGERVMTAAEARSADARAVQVTISGNEFVVRQDSDIDAIATALADKIRLAALSGVTTWQ